MAKPLELKGLREVNQGLKKLGKQYPIATAHAMYAEAMEVQREATRRAPVEFGPLRASAYTVPPTSKSLITETGFGTEYAARQHEELAWQHPRGGEAKYLENAYNQRSGGMLQRLAEYIKKLVARGVETEPTAMGNTRPVVKPAPKRLKKNKAKARPKAGQVKAKAPRRKR